MNQIVAADKIISRAEAEIAALVQQAVAEGKFGEAKRLVDALAALASVRRDVQGDSQSLVHDEPRPQVVRETISSLEADQSSSARKRQSQEFPRFFRSEDRLIKIGWSTKERTTYEQRVPRDIVMAVCTLMAERIKAKKPFKMEKLLPMVDEDGKEVPSYQAYLILKWLQHFGAVERRGRDGYVVGPGGLSPDIVGSLWSRTSEQMPNS